MVALFSWRSSREGLQPNVSLRVVENDQIKDGLSWLILAGRHTTMGKRNYFTGYGILLHELPVVAVLFNQSNDNEGTMQ